MPTPSRLVLSVLALSSILGVVGTADAGPRRGGRQNSVEAPAPTSKAQLLVNRSLAMMNCQSTRFSAELDDLADELAELLEEVDSNTSEDDIFDFAFDFEDDLFDEEWKATLKINRVADRGIARLAFMGADPSFALQLETARATAVSLVEASTMDMLTQLDIAVEEALAIAALPDDEGSDDDDDHGCGDDDDESDDDDDSDDDDRRSGRERD